MRFRADDHCNRRCTEKSVRFRVPAGLLEDAVARGGERAKIRDRGAGDKSATRFGRKPQDIEQPAQRDLFEESSGRGGAVETGVLVPGAREPVGRERERERTADDESEESWSSNRYHTG